MKVAQFVLVFLASLLVGCKSDPYGPLYGPVILGSAALDSASRALKEHIHAAPGTRLDDFEDAIMEAEHEKTVVPETYPGTNGVWHYVYEGRKAMYLGTFVKETAPPADNVFFSADEIWNPTALAAKLRTPADPVSSWLNERLSEDARTAIASYPASGQDENSLKQILARELNAIISGPLIYDKERFRDVPLRPVTANYLRVSPPPRYASMFRAVVNRMLLEDAYPQELVKKQRILYTHYYVATNDN